MVSEQICRVQQLAACGDARPANSSQCSKIATPALSFSWEDEAVCWRYSPAVVASTITTHVDFSRCHDRENRRMLRSAYAMLRAPTESRIERTSAKKHSPGQEDILNSASYIWRSHVGFDLSSFASPRRIRGSRHIFTAAYGIPITEWAVWEQLLSLR